jgi:hypothetical protein
MDCDLCLEGAVNPLRTTYGSFVPVTGKSDYPHHRKYGVVLLNNIDDVKCIITTIVGCIQKGNARWRTRQRAPLQLREAKVVIGHLNCARCTVIQC